MPPTDALTTMLARMRRDAEDGNPMETARVVALVDAVQARLGMIGQMRYGGGDGSVIAWLTTMDELSAAEDDALARLRALAEVEARDAS